MRTPKGLEEEVAWAISNSKGTSLRVSIFKISLAAAIYHLWCERNGRIFKGSSKSPCRLRLKMGFVCVYLLGGISLIFWPTNRS